MDFLDANSLKPGSRAVKKQKSIVSEMSESEQMEAAIAASLAATDTATSSDSNKPNTLIDLTETEQTPG